MEIDIIDQFRKEYFSNLGAHEKSMNVLASYLSGQYNEQDIPYIDENLARSEFKRILENKIKAISPNLSILVNKNNRDYNISLQRKIKDKINTELDLQVIDQNRRLIAAYELKSLCNKNKGSANDIYRDFYRLSLIKVIMPKVTAIFLLVGKDEFIFEYFTKNKLLIPFKYLRKGVIINRILDFDTNARLYRLSIDQSPNKYQATLKDLRVRSLKFRISRRPYSLNMHAYSFEILYPEFHEVRYKVGAFS